MYTCTLCHKLSQPGEPAAIIVTETRDVTYPAREHAMRKGRGKNLRWVADPGGVGQETVKEEIRHERCV